MHSFVIVAIMCRVINVKIFKVKTQTVALCRQIFHWVLRSKHKLELYVDTIALGSLRSKRKLSLNVDTFESGH